MSHLNFWILAFSTIFCPTKRHLSDLVTLFDRKLQVFKNSPKWTIFVYSKCKLAMLDETFSVIFKHRDNGNECTKVSWFSVSCNFRCNAYYICKLNQVNLQGVQTNLVQETFCRRQSKTFISFMIIDRSITPWLCHKVFATKQHCNSLLHNVY